MKDLKVLILYAALALLATMPLVFHLTAQFPSVAVWEGGDPDLYMWYSNAVASEIANPSGFEFGKQLFWPRGINPFGGYEGSLIFIVTVPIILLTSNVILAYNVTLLLAMILTCYACYKLIHYLTGNYWAALLTGFTFGLSPYMIVRGTQHLDLVLLFTVPMLVLRSLMFVREPSNRNIFWLASAVLVTVFAAWYYLVAGLIFMGLLFLFSWKEFLAAKWQYVKGAIAVGLAVGLPAIPMFLNRTDASQQFAGGLVDQTGAQVLNFFLPHPFTSLGGNFTDWIYKTFPAASYSYKGEGYPYFESTSYFGLVGILAVIALYFLRKKIAVPNKKLWIATMAVFTVIAMGTTLDLGKWVVPMPFHWMREVMPFSHLRAPNRFFVFAYMAATVVFGYFVSALPGLIRNRRTYQWVMALIVVALAGERIIFPYPVMELPVPQFYKDLGKQTERFAIADLPLTFPGHSSYNYYQIYHKKPIVEGEFFWTTYDSQTFKFIRDNELLANSFRCSGITDQDSNSAVKELADNDIRYVVVHNFLINQSECSELVAYLHKVFAGQEPVFADGEITVYQTRP